MNYTQEDFERMLKKDEEVYVNLLQIEKIVSREQNAWTNGKPINQIEFNKLMQLENEAKEIRKRYETRQNDYKTNKTFEFGQTISNWVSDFTDDVLNSIGLGAVQIAVPVAWVVGTALVTGVIVYFCTAYFTETEIDYTDSLRIVKEVSEVNPELADKMLDSLNHAKSEEIKHKTSLVKNVGSLAITIGLAYLIYSNREKIPKLLKLKT